jgi:hypothetical protein
VGQIELGATSRARQGWAGTATVEYDGDIWAIDLDMIDVFVTEMVGFFDEIAAPDWTGPSRWQSEFAELTVGLGPNGTISSHSISGCGGVAATSSTTSAKGS